MAAVAMRFPDRTTLIGQMIDQYLRDKTHYVDDHAIHLLFSANRWEASTTLTNHLYQGTTVVCDRHAYSGVAFLSAKEQEVVIEEEGGSTTRKKFPCHVHGMVSKSGYWIAGSRCCHFSRLESRRSRTTWRVRVCFDDVSLCFSLVRVEDLRCPTQ
jgi:Thymidylate kinase